MTHTVSAVTTLAPAIVAHVLDTATLLQLTQRKIGVLHIKRFYPPEHGTLAAMAAITHPKLGYYHKQYTSSVGRICTPHIDSEWDTQAAERYHREALENTHDMRELFSPYPSPADRVRLLLQEYWPAGANLQRLHGRPCFVGAIRVFKPSTSKFYPHNDRLDEESDAPELEGMVEQLVANMYLQVPSVGGDLQLWLREPTVEETERIRDVEGLLPDSIEPPALVIHPEAGDLIIFSSRMLHAVTSSDEDYRIGMAAFIGCFGPQRPLTYWS
ncbi:hypothetical protein [Pseudomonas sp. 18175]|uniref:hypothetical protein n=1 Tax=Pseudomonas sp. 18175 TaxID=3390056 RepID=UPI003D1F9BDB